MDAKAFWTQLEYRVCREIDGLRTDEIRGLWCDGFIPEQFELRDGRACVVGRVWMGRGGRHQEKWQFALLLPEGIASEAEVDWASMFPSEDVTGWLSLDQNKREMKVNPVAAHADGRPAAQ